MSFDDEVEQRRRDLSYSVSHRLLNTNSQNGSETDLLAQTFPANPPQPVIGRGTSKSVSHAPVEVPVRKEENVSRRAYKFLTSKAMDTKLGRKIMLQGLGKDVLMLCEDIRPLVTEYYGEEKTKELQKEALKFVLKTQTSMHSHCFTMTDSMVVEEPIQNFCFRMYLLFSGHEESKDAVEKLRISFIDALGVWISTLGPNLSDSNLQSMNSWIQEVSKVEFIEFLADKSVFNNHMLRDGILHKFHRLIDQHSIAVGPTDKYCAVSYCGKKTVPPKGFFRGTNMCRNHHMAEFQRIKKSPLIEDFVKNELYRRYLFDYLNSQKVSEQALSVLNLAILINVYKKSTRWKTRYDEALLILENMQEGAACFPIISENICKQVNSQFEQAKGYSMIMPLDLFDEVHTISFQYLNANIIKGFQDSKEFIRFQLTYKVPETIEVVVDEKDELFGFQLK